MAAWGRAEDLLDQVFDAAAYTCTSTKVADNDPLLIVRGIWGGLTDLARSQNARIQEFCVSHGDLLRSKKRGHWK